MYVLVQCVLELPIMTQCNIVNFYYALRVTCKCIYSNSLPFLLA